MIRTKISSATEKTLLPSAAVNDERVVVGGRRTRVLTCILAATVGLVATLVCFYPGYMSPDSFEQLAQARSGAFTDWHPPIMSLLWRLLDKVYAGPFGILLLHNILFWSAIAVLCYTIAGRAAGVAILIFGFLPPVFSLLSTIWKDVGFGATLLLACALLLFADRYDSKKAWILSLAPLFYAVAVRHNGALAALPIMILAGLLFGRLFLKRTSWKVSFAVGISLLIVTYSLVAMINRALVKDRHMYIYQTMLMHDLVALAIASNEVRLPAWTYGSEKRPTVEDMKRIYDPASLIPVFCGDASVLRLRQSTNKNEIEELERTWLIAVRDHPGAYLLHRLSSFKAMLGIQRREVCYPYHSGVDPNSIGIVLPQSSLNSAVMQLLGKVKDSILFRGWFYLTITVLLLVATSLLPLTRNLRSFLLVVGSSSLLYELPYFFVVPTCDFRYNWWTVVAGLTMIFCVVAGFLGRSENRGEPRST